MNQPRFTFCIPNLNKIKYLPACIDSILAQDCDDWCCVFVDGYSTDGSWEYMQQYAADPRFLIRRGIRQGMYQDWNECLKYVNTEYFYFLPSDDTCLPTLVTTTVNALDRHPDIAACHFQYAVINACGKTIKSPAEIIETRLDLYKEVNCNAHRRSGICEFMMQFVYCAPYTSMTSLVLRSRLIDQLQGFKTIYGHAGDFDWTMRLTLLTDILYIPKLLATWRVYEDQATQRTNLVNYFDITLAIVSDNLDTFIQSEQKQYLRSPLNSYQLLSDYLDNYLYGLYIQIFKEKDWLGGTKNLLRFISKYPLCLPRKALRKASFNKAFSRVDKATKAHYLIKKYDLPWPPTILQSGVG